MRRIIDIKKETKEIETELASLMEKTAFEFPLTLQEVDMWYDKAEKQWKKGLPPIAPTAGK